VEGSALTTGEKLIAAAAAEFNDHGFSGTDTNKIARRAGFAPQTFYRWFKDKTEIFIAVYRGWEEEERDLLCRLVAGKAPEDALVELGIEHLRRYLKFRRSLRQLAREDAGVRRARAESRARQIAEIKGWAPASAALADGWIGAALITQERLSDAIAEGELGEMGVDEAAARTVIARILAGIRSGEL